MFNPDPAELESLLSQLDQTLYNHERWYDGLVSTLVCRLPYDEHDVDHEAFRKCRFGQWLYGQGQKLLQGHESFIPIEAEHRRMHQLAGRLLQAQAAGAPIALGDYEIFASALKRLRLEVSTLQRELQDLRANLDPLTGAMRRTTLLTLLREQQALVKRQVTPCAVAMLDLDHFKAVNDTYGHQAGDRVLSVTARYAMEHLRPYDKVFRYGGEEFVVCLLNAGPDLAFSIIDRLREGLAQTPIYHNEQLINATVSCGIASLDPDLSVDQTVDRADQAMYMAKTAGRNCTRLWKAPQPAGQGSD
jgi:diguanylate cyclase (GGDEF)-like protein